jgi:hypothetical protein
MILFKASERSISQVSHFEEITPSCEIYRTLLQNKINISEETYSCNLCGNSVTDYQ